ncbi:MAG TPA: hypothetical protein VGJ63_21355 [Micromonosporaceae bacterium]
MTTLAEPAQDASPPPPRRGRRWLIAAAAAWALLLAGTAYWSARHDPATVREQRSVGEALPVVERAAGRLAAAAGPDAVLEIVAPRLTTGCRITSARAGATLEQDVRIFVPPAEAAVQLDRLGDRLPEAYRVRVRHPAHGDHTLRADAGEFVGIRGGVTGPGIITLTVATGCRPDDRPVLADTLVLAPPELVAAASPVAAALGVGAGESVGSTRVQCDDAGNVARSVRLTSQPGTVPGPLPVALHDRLAGTTPALSTADLVAYRHGGVALVAQARDGRVTVVATQPCPAQ